MKSEFFTFVASFLKAASQRRFIKGAALLAVVSSIAYATAPPANTQIGNSATATYTDSTNTSRSATSNTVVTVVQQVSSFTITADQAKYAAPGGQVYFPHTLVNTGNGTDSFNLTATNNGGDDFDLTSLTLYADANGDGLPDNSTPLTSTGPLAAGTTYKFVAAGIVPGSATSAQVSNTTVTAIGTATAAPAAAQTNTDTTNVTNNAVVNVTKSVSSSSGAPGSGPHTFTLTYNNTGNSTATNVTLTDAIPAGMTYVANSARWSVTGPSVPLTDAAGGVQGSAPDTITYDFGQTTPGRVTAIVARILPGESRTVTFAVTVNSPLSAGTIQNTATYAYDPGTGTPVGPFNTNTVTFNVTQGTGVTIGNSTVASATQGGTVVFTNTVTNTGNGPDSFGITVANSTFPPGTTFQLFKADGNTPLVDTNSDNTPDTGTMPASGTYNVIVKAILPPGSSGINVNYTALVTATSTTNNSTTATGNDVLVTVAANTVDLTNTAALPGGAGIGAGPEAGSVVTNTTNPGTTTRFTLFVNNTSAISDTFNLSSSTDSTFAGLTLPAGWTVVFRDASNAVITTSGVVAAGGNKQVFADVTIPAGQAPGTTDLYFRAQSPTTGTTDRIHDAVTVNTVRSITVSPNNTGQIAPGGSTVYTHTLTNNGNVLEGNGTVSSITLTPTESAAGWSSVIYYDANNNGIIDGGDPVVTNTSFVSAGTAGLSPGESVTLLVKVTAPPGAALGSQDATTLTATTTNGSYATTVPGAATATDTSTVINGDIKLQKEQALDAAPLDGVPDTAYSAAQINAGAAPGKAIRYRITVTNQGTAPATNVQVYDSTPAYTTYTTTGPAAITGGSVGTVVTTPVNGAAGALQFNVGTLNPAESAVITFGVIINQ